MSEYTAPPRGANVPRVARLADAIVVVLAGLAVFVHLTGGFAARPWGMRVSITSPWRVLGWALLVLAARHAWLRRPSFWHRWGPRWIFGDARAPEPLAPPGTFGERTAMHAVVIGGFSALTCLVLFEQVVHLRSVSDLGDPLFSTWRLDWIAYQLRTDPLHLFDANIFHPEPRTLAYSDAILVPALVAAPWLWMGADVVVLHNLLMLAASAFSGVTMFWLVRWLTQCTEAAIVSGVVFALYPLRWAFQANLELEMTLWMPLALLWLHRTIASGRTRHGLMTGVAVALQTLSSFYFGLFLSMHMFVVAAVSGLTARDRIRSAVGPLAAGALLAAVVVAPATLPYFKNRATVGERHLADTARFSARPRDYVAAHPSSRVYGRVLPGDGGKLELFPGVISPVLAAAAVWLPLSPAAAAHAAALGISANASLGVYGSTYPLLYTLVLPFRGLRAPDRFAVLVGFSLAVLAGYGVARVLRGVRRRAARCLITAGLAGAIAVESAPVLNLTPVWTDVPAIYDAIPPGDAVLVDLPFPQRDGSTPGEYAFLYFATFHHKRLVNGGSGFYPPWYDPLADLMRAFPNEPAMVELKRHGAEYLAVHGAFYAPEEYRRLTAALDQRTDVALVTSRPWNGTESRLYRISRQ